MITIEYENSNCPVCESGNIEKLYTKNINEVCIEGIIKVKIHLSICKECGCIFQQPVPTEFGLEKYYQMQSDNIDESTNIRFWYYDMYDFISNNVLIQNINKVLDIGCRRGEMLRLFKSEGKQVFGIEPSQYNADYVRNNFKIPVKVGVFNDEIVNDGEYDLIILTNVLEHIKEPSNMLRTIYSKLATDGNLFISIPKLEGCLNESAYNNIADYFCFEHIQYLTLEQLSYMVKKNRFSIKCSKEDKDCIFLVCNKTNNKDIDKYKLENQYNNNLNIINTYLKNRKNSIESINEKLSKIESNGLVIYGAGAHTTQLMQIMNFDKLKLRGICDSDSNKNGMILGGVKVSSIEELNSNEFSDILISSRAYEKEIYEYLLDRFSDKKIIKIYS